MMSEKLTKAQSTTLRFIGDEPRPCQCQFNEDDLAWLGAFGMISIAVCTDTGHGWISLTDAGRAVLSSATPE